MSAASLFVAVVALSGSFAWAAPNRLSSVVETGMSRGSGKTIAEGAEGKNEVRSAKLRKKRHPKTTLSSTSCKTSSSTKKVTTSTKKLPTSTSTSYSTSSKTSSSWVNSTSSVKSTSFTSSSKLLPTTTSSITVSTTVIANLTSTISSATALPTVDLVYAIHQATVNETGNYYNFSNIAYAAPPVGDLRFAAPIPPTTINRTINDGQQGSICAQAVPFWPQIALYAAEGYSLAQLDAVQAQLTAYENSLTIGSLPQTRGDAKEDCLHLDVIVPESIFNNASSKAPVLVWVYGGGYVYGGKSSAGNPATLIAQAQKNNGEGVIFVAMNYRVGLFGWLSGSTVNAQGGLSNAALYDQRLAFEWVQANIHLFGGDASRVTVVGESAGAGSIMHQITAFGGNRGAPAFSQAILQSPGFLPVPGNAQQETTFASVLSQAQALISPNVTSLASLRSLDFSTLAGLNSVVVARSYPYGTFTFGPVVDGLFVPDMTGKLLYEGRFDAPINVMVGHNSNEGATLTSPFLVTESLLAANLVAVFPGASNTTISYMLNTIWPPIYNGSYPYTNIAARASLITAEVSFTCNTRYLDLAYENKTHAYYFTVPPGFHGEDVAYTFYNGDYTTLNDGLAVQPAIATALQTYLTSFAISEEGDPNRRGMPFFPEYQANSTVLELGIAGVGALSRDTTANVRCDWLMLAPYEN